MSETIQQDPAAQMPAAPAKVGNGFAVAGFITGLLPLPLFGLIFSVIGLVKSTKVSKGKILSILGIVLSLAWIGVGAYVGPHVVKAADPGCRVATKLNNDYPDSKVQADSSDPAKLGADLQAIYAGLTDAAKKAKNADAKAALETYATDYGTFLQAAAQGQQDATLVAKLNADDDKANAACGAF